MMNVETVTENGVIVTPRGRKERVTRIGTSHPMNVKSPMSLKMSIRKTCSYAFSTKLKDQTRPARERGRKTKTTKLMAVGVGRHEVQLERVNTSPSPTHSVRESEWAKAEVVLHAASGCPRGTHLIREMDRPKVAGRDMPPRQTRAKNFWKNTKATNPPKMDNEGKKPSASKRKNSRYPTIPSWRRGFFTTIHSFLVAHDLDNLSKSAVAESSEEAPGAIIKFQVDGATTIFRRCGIHQCRIALFNSI
uniref:Uncharacterized protein n=1 Tax=Solanum tuberosum TaxID=4113 RepID=M1E1A9_SOLTU